LVTKFLTVWVKIEADMYILVPDLFLSRREEVFAFLCGGTIGRLASFILGK
jgi:hypothetical protein